ncbi:unnamed protein product [Cunninghamella blakesleeana]
MNKEEWEDPNIFKGSPCSLSISKTPSRPIPLTVLKVQLKRLVQQHCERTRQQREGEEVIATKNLLALIDAYEKEHDVVLLTTEQKSYPALYFINT